MQITSLPRGRGHLNCASTKQSHKLGGTQKKLSCYIVELGNHIYSYYI